MCDPSSPATSSAPVRRGLDETEPTVIATHHLLRPGRRAVLVVLAAVAVLANVMVVAPAPAQAGVLVPGSCGNWSGVWGAWFLGDRSGAVDDVIFRDLFSDLPGGSGPGGSSTLPLNSTTAPLHLDLQLPASAIRNNDSSNYADFRAMLYAGPSHAASFTLNDDGSFSYVPVAGYLGGDSFQYVLQSGSWCTNPATVTILPPRRPRAVDDHYTAFRDTPLSSPRTGWDGF
jgi:hypothetical protein